MGIKTCQALGGELVSKSRSPKENKGKKTNQKNDVGFLKDQLDRKKAGHNKQEKMKGNHNHKAKRHWKGNI